MRGWRRRTLGPGSYINSSDNVDKLGEIKLEFSAEYRFPVTSIIKGALFIDGGNIWTQKPDTDLEGFGSKNFDFGLFYKEFAVSPGIGIRLDFDFFLLFDFDFLVFFTFLDFFLDLIIFLDFFLLVFFIFFDFFFFFFFLATISPNWDLSYPSYK